MDGFYAARMVWAGSPSGVASDDL